MISNDTNDTGRNEQERIGKAHDGPAPGYGSPKGEYRSENELTDADNVERSSSATEDAASAGKARTLNTDGPERTGTFNDSKKTPDTK